jgi:hypothetical protein
MSDKSEMMPIEEAMAYIKLHFTQSEGLLAQIEQGRPIPNDQVEKLEVALRSLQEAWSHTELIAKQEASLLWNVIPRLEQGLLQYPHQEAEIRDLMFKLSVWFDQMFMTQDMSEEQAIAVISQHIIGPSFLAEVLHGEAIKSAGIEEVFTAVDVLAQIWKKKETISKLAAGALITTQCIPVSEYYSEHERRKIQKTLQALQDHITECWK